MAERENILQVPRDVVHEVDWQTATRHIACLPGRVVIEMIPWGDRWGALYLPEQVAANMRPDVGVVLAVGAKADLNFEGEIVRVTGPEDEIMPGDIVVVRGYDGTWREDFQAGSYKAKGQVRSYGIFSHEGTYGEPKLYEWWDSILYRITNENKMVLLRDNMHVKRDPIVTEVGTDVKISLPEFRKFGSNVATVLEVGPKCTVKPGTRFIHDPAAMLDIELKGWESDHAICSEKAVEMILTDEAA